MKLMLKNRKIIKLILTVYIFDAPLFDFLLLSYQLYLSLFKKYFHKKLMRDTAILAISPRHRHLSAPKDTLRYMHSITG